MQRVIKLSNRDVSRGLYSFSRSVTQKAAAVEGKEANGIVKIV